MVKLVILYQQPADPQTFENRYNSNLALLERMEGIRRRQAGMVLGAPTGQPSIYRTLELYFDDFDALDKAMLSEEGRAAGQDLMQFAGHDTQLLFVEVFED
jgi:uncharacterized protein (TIGR02118 family)